MLLSGANSKLPTGQAPSSAWLWPHPVRSTWYRCFWTKMTGLASHLTEASSTTCFLFVFFSFLRLTLFFACKALRLLSKAWGNIPQLFPFSLQIKFRRLFPFEYQATLLPYKENCFVDNLLAVGPKWGFGGFWLFLW